MKILLIDNDTLYIKNLKRALVNYSFKISSYDNINLKEVNKFDKIILSGGHGKSIVNNPEKYSKEIYLIRNFKKPILGICLGFELIAYAYGEKLEILKKRMKGIRSIRKIANSPILSGLNKFKVYENHRWSVKKLKFLRSIAKSKSEVEILKHPKKKIYGAQFHPEMVIDNKGYKILENFLLL